MRIYNLLIYVENDSILDNFFFERLLNTIYFPLVYALLFSINLIKMMKIHSKVV